MILPFIRSLILLFDQWRHHYFVPTNDCNAVARNSGPGRPNASEAALSWTVASPVTYLRLSRASVCAVVSMMLVLTAECHFAGAVERTVAYRKSSQTSDPFGRFIDEAAQRFTIPAQWIKSILRVESALDAHAKSNKGAMGLMQVMPATWAELRLRYALGDDPYDPHDNILAGAAYLRELYDRYGFAGAFAAYNAGPARYKQHLAGDPLPVETQADVTKIAFELEAASASTSPNGPRFWSTSPLFPAPYNRIGATEWHQPERASNSALTVTGRHTTSEFAPKPAGLFVTRLDAGERG
ncbi:lytic transglycosylase domain-containing protein [Frankia sp. RB7]|nr:lytic transglycosylase domain-containing protein [Frankia sp. RB7]